MYTLLVILFSTIFNLAITIPDLHYHKTKPCAEFFGAPSITTPTSIPDFPSSPFGVISARSASPIHFLDMNAAGQRFWLGGEPATYCPLNVTLCPPGNLTAFRGLISLDVLVPGGQQIYVDPSLAIGFTQAHSIFMPPGAQVGGFSYTAPKPGGNGLGHLDYSGFGATGFMACPTSDGRWQVFVAGSNATTPLGDVSQCFGFKALTADYDGPIPAWQYV